jgi:hypothetical protein
VPADGACNAKRKRAADVAGDGCGVVAKGQPSTEANAAPIASAGPIRNCSFFTGVLSQAPRLAGGLAALGPTKNPVQVDLTGAKVGYEQCLPWEAALLRPNTSQLVNGT